MISLRLSDRRRRRRRRRRRLLLRELVAELVDLARRRRELRSQAAKAGRGGDHRRHCRQYFSGDAVLRGGPYFSHPIFNNRKIGVLLEVRIH